MRGTIWRTYDSIRTSSSSSAQCFDIETKPASVMAYVIRSEDVRHTLQVADSIFKSKTRSLLFRPLDRRSPNQVCKDTIYIFFFYKTLFYILLARPVTLAVVFQKTNFFCQGCCRDCHCRTEDGTAQGADFQQDYPLEWMYQKQQRHCNEIVRQNRERHTARWWEIKMWAYLFFRIFTYSCRLSRSMAVRQ